jgi:HD-like signal output (HDOD) protein
MQFDALFDHASALPTVPKVVQDLIISLDDDNVMIGELAPKIAADPVLSARLLRLANSAYYHPPRPIGTIEDALRMLGFSTVRTLVISAGLTSSFRPIPGLELSAFWRYSMKCAVVARWLADRSHVDAGQAFTIGLMHAIGQLVMHAAMPEKMLAVSRVAGGFDPRRGDVEKHSFGYHFADVGARLAELWRFPKAYPAALQGWMDPLEEEELNRLAGIIHIAAWRARCDENALDPEEIAGTAPIKLLGALGLEDTLLEEMPSPRELAAEFEGLFN